MARRFVKLCVAFSVARSWSSLAFSYSAASSNELLICSTRRVSSLEDWEATASTSPWKTRKFLALTRMLCLMRASLYVVYVTVLLFSLYSEAPVVEILCLSIKSLPKLGGKGRLTFFEKATPFSFRPRTRQEPMPSWLCLPRRVRHRRRRRRRRLDQAAKFHRHCPVPDGGHGTRDLEAGYFGAVHSLLQGRRRWHP